MRTIDDIMATKTLRSHWLRRLTPFDPAERRAQLGDTPRRETRIVRPCLGAHLRYIVRMRRRLHRQDPRRGQGGLIRQRSADRVRVIARKARSLSKMHDTLSPRERVG